MSMSFKASFMPSICLLLALGPFHFLFVPSHQLMLQVTFSIPLSGHEALVNCIQSRISAFYFQQTIRGKIVFLRHTYKFHFFIFLSFYISEGDRFEGEEFAEGFRLVHVQVTC